jgi:hypothetical protein
VTAWALDRWSRYRDVTAVLEWPSTRTGLRPG